ncbi:MAG TPA: glutamine--fructose-6-phosphate transaminase (isomerizing), partial [Planctomycetota bacterium]|nr:glutamine--fructose-6-phosphate transaminase (isomerizing) [Planctomycetota bacterium]
MCGIVTYTGKHAAAPILLEGLHRLEYRGYDSAGIAVLGSNGHGIALVKAPGKVAGLDARIAGNGGPPEGATGIAHTRWATHGAPSEANAHPHADCRDKLALVHNGIVENHAELRERLRARGHVFRSETDTEVLAHLVEESYAGDLPAALKAALAQVRGTFGVALIHRDHPGVVVAARRSSPLVIGVGEGECLVASDVAALVRHTREVVYLEEDEIAVTTPEGYAIRTLDGAAVARAPLHVEWGLEEAERGGFPHFMLKEICEQPETIRNALRGRTLRDAGDARLGGLLRVLPRIDEKRHAVIVSCGSSYYSGLAGRAILEELTDLSVEVDLASEFRYRRVGIDAGTLLLAISQSGETADTLAALREAKRRAALCLGLVNVVGSTIARETHAGVYNHAGPEIGVASTKAFTSQIAILALMGVLIGRRRG